MIYFNKLTSEFNLYFSKNYVQSRAALFLFFFSLLYFVVIVFNLDTLHSVLDNHWQTADIEALKKDPAKALLHLHSQPPLFNFFYWLFSLMPGEAYDYFVFFYIIVFVGGIWLSSILARSKSWWAGGAIGGVTGVVIGIISGLILTGLIATGVLVALGLFLDRAVSLNYAQRKAQNRSPSWWAGGGSSGGGGGFGGFGGGGFGGGGSSGGW